MAKPRVPGGGSDTLELPCDREVPLQEFDLGMREYECDCGETHAVVMDVHPLERFLPEFLVEVLQGAIEPESEEMPEFETPHLLGVVLEEFPDRIAVADASENGDLGYGMVWVAEFDARRLHEVVVELVVELMEHAVSHAEDDGAMAEFEQQMLEFDVSEFVEQYRARRDLSEDDVYA
jgi:hypothetical protein